MADNYTASTTLRLPLRKGNSRIVWLWINANFQTIKIHIFWHCWGGGDTDFSRELKVMLSGWTRRDGCWRAAAFQRWWRKEATQSDFLTAKLSRPIYELSSFISFCLKHLDGRDGHHWVKTISTVYLKICACVCEQSEPGIGPHNVQRSHVPPPHSVCSTGNRRFNLRLSSSDITWGKEGGPRERAK